MIASTSDGSGGNSTGGGVEAKIPPIMSINMRIIKPYVNEDKIEADC